MTNFSSASQAVMDAFLKAPMGQSHVDDDLIAVAAALRAAADHTVPEQAEPPCGEKEPWPQSYQLMADSKWEQRQQTRANLLAIAAELEGDD
jgi:hypothetical protein